MEDVKRIVDRANKYSERKSDFDFLGALAAFLFFIFIVTDVVLFVQEIVGPKVSLLNWFAFGSLTVVSVITAFVLFFLSDRAGKRATGEMNSLMKICNRLISASQSYSEFFSFFKSTNVIAVLQGPETDDEKIIIILILESELQNEKIEMFKMGKEEVKAMFKPMFK